MSKILEVSLLKDAFIFKVVDEIYDKFAAGRMGIDQKGQVVLMIHCGSRGFGHQVATDALVSMEKAMKRDKIEVNDRQLACARIQSKEGQEYLNGMAAAANFAWVKIYFCKTKRAILMLILSNAIFLSHDSIK